MVEFTHIQNERAQMVDISAKNDVIREAVAVGKIFLKPETMKAIREGYSRERKCSFHCPCRSDTFGQKYALPYTHVPFNPDQCDYR